MKWWHIVLGLGAGYLFLRKKDPSQTGITAESQQLGVTSQILAVAKKLEDYYTSISLPTTINVAWTGTQYELSDAASGAVLITAKNLADAQSQVDWMIHGR